MGNPNIYRQQSQLYEKINAAIHRWRRDTAVKGVAIVLSIFAFGLGFMALFSAYWTAAPYLIPAVAIVTGIAFLYSLIRYIILPFRKDISPEKIARFLETEHPELEDRLVTALDASIRRGSLDIFWLTKVIDQADAHTRKISFEQEVTSSKTPFWALLSVAAGALLIFVLFSKTEWQPHIATMINSDFTAPQPLPELYVTPGDSRVKRGASLQVAATLKNYIPDAVQLYFSGPDSVWQNFTMQPQGDKKADVGYELFDIQSGFQYYVKAGTEISEVFNVSVFEAPQIKQIDLAFRYPAFTQLKPRKEKDSGDVWAPAGTKVTVEVLSTVVVTEAELLLGDNKSLAMNLISDSTARASFKVEKDSFYKIRLATSDGLDNKPLAEYFIRALQNQPPSITVLKPNRDIKATMLEEIPVSAEISDDFGLDKAVLVVQVNSEKEKEFQLRQKSGVNTKDALTYQTHEFSTLLYLEDLNLKPGDFASYYFKAHEGQSGSTVSDMYYIEITNFDNIYRVATSSGGGGGGGGDAPQFAKLQKDIITAATKLIQNKKVMPGNEYKLNIESLYKTQTDVRTSIESIVQRAKLRGRMLQQQQNQIVDALADAVKAMKFAEPKIEHDSLKAAMPDMRSAYRYLLKADVLVRERQISNSRSQGQGGAQNQRELTRLFQDELDKIKNKYETLQQGDTKQAQQEQDEALRKIQELARRQNQINQANRQLAQQNLPEEENKRQIKKLQRQQEELNRDTQKQMQDMANKAAQNRENTQQSAQNSQELRKASQAMNRATQKLQQAQPQNALANGQQALDRLRKLEQKLQQSQKDDISKELKNIENEMRSIAQKQNEIAAETSRLKKESSPDSTAVARNIERQNQLRETFENAMDELNQLTHRESTKKQDANQDLQQVERKIEQENIDGRMRDAEASLKKSQLSEAEKMQNSIHQDLTAANADFKKVLDKFKDSNQEKIGQALKETRKMRESLEEFLSQSQKSNPDRQGNEGSAGQEKSDKTDQQLQEAIWKSRENFRKLSELVAGIPDMHSQFKDLQNIANGIVRNAVPGSQRLDLIEAQLVYKMKLIEAELQAQLHVEEGLDATQGFETVKIPQEYRELVEEYFRNLSSARKK
ncbi:MAG: hypothetical protein DWQ05_10040 [Calditrichaeota bacterium]|nr:MAG: hypothetical protein DWQ05_10040 [Calditrichota bacterium]